MVEGGGGGVLRRSSYNSLSTRGIVSKLLVITNMYIPIGPLHLTYRMTRDLKYYIKNYTAVKENPTCPLSLTATVSAAPPCS